jgi:hypothetical protein
MIIGGTTRPPFFGSILPSLSWKGFTLTMNIGYRFGYYFRRGTISYSSFYNSWAGNMDFYNRWISPGDEKFTTVPSMSYPANSSRDAFYQYSTATVEKGAHIRLQDLSLNWQKENVKLGSLKIKKISLYSYINNIGIIRRANLAGLDPDYGNSQPPPTGFSFGSKINF